jgi:peptidyl-prolyl cis-trans isomerase SurA
MATAGILASMTMAPHAHAVLAERVVAVVGDHAILWSDMHQRARPYLLQIRQRTSGSALLAAAESEMYKQLVEKLVDDRVEQQAADKAHLTVTPDEIDAALRTVAAQQGLTVQRLIEEATRAGLTPAEYRDELRHQLLEGKLLQLRVRGRVRVTEDDIRALYDRLVREERARLGYRLAWVVVRGDASPSVDGERERLAERVAATARHGVDARGQEVTFAELARRFSDDASTRSLGGDLGVHQPGDLAPRIEDEAHKLEVGSISAPFRFKGDWVVLRVVGRDASRLPSFEDARDELLQRIYGEQMQKARRQWIDELRRATYVEVRL